MIVICNLEFYIKLKIQSTVSNMLGWIIACHGNVVFCLDNFRSIACSSIPTNIQLHIFMQRVLQRHERELYDEYRKLYIILTHLFSIYYRFIYIYIFQSYLISVIFCKQNALAIQRMPHLMYTMIAYKFDEVRELNF